MKYCLRLRTPNRRQHTAADTAAAAPVGVDDSQ